jgi:hypothetical protein
VAVEDDLASAKERIQNAGRKTGELLLHCKGDAEAIRLLHDLIGYQSGALNSIRFAERKLTAQ